jgi:hypothetical protein
MPETFLDLIKSIERRLGVLERTGGGDSLDSLIINEIPSGTINGSNQLFTLANKYKAASTMVYKNGSLLKPTTDYTETSTTAGTITFAVAPAGGSVILITYRKVV